MRRPSVLRSISSILICIFIFACPLPADAAAGSLNAPKITSGKAKGASVTVKWKKAAGAKSYRVYVQTGGHKWEYWKKVSKTTANREKYSDNLKYKLKVSGRKYKVYRQKHTFKVAVKSTKKLTYTYKGKYGKTYRVAIRSVKGKKLSKKASTRKVRTPAAKENSSEEPKPVYAIAYELNGGENASSNPAAYTSGDGAGLADPSRDGYAFRGWYTDSGFTNRIDRIGSDAKGDLTLYAKWSLAALNINGEGMDDMIWSWWYYPQVVTAGDSTFWGYATKEGYCGVAKHEVGSDAVTKTALKKAESVDDHNGIALTLLKDGRIMCAFAGGHNSDKYIYIRISDKPMDISSFGTEAVLDSAGVTSYSQIIENNGTYYLFYRVNNQNWAYRTSADGVEWTDEVILIKGGLQYYCRFVPTTDSRLIRVLMYSNPSGAAPEIRMGFLNTSDKCLYDADAATKLGSSDIGRESFRVLHDVQKDKTQRLFDAEITAPDKPRFLFAAFTNKKAKNDSIYYLYDSGKTYQICEGGDSLMDPKYQLGASFAGPGRIVAARGHKGSDCVELYRYDSSGVTLEKTIYASAGNARTRSARPVADREGRAVLWHNGYYDNSTYTNYDTSAALYLTAQGKPVGADGSRYASLAQAAEANVQTVEAYADRLYKDNTLDDYSSCTFTWDAEARTSGKDRPCWIYYSGFMMEAFLMINSDAYNGQVREYYNQNISYNKSAGTASIPKYQHYTLDGVLPAVGMEQLLQSGLLSEDEAAKYKAGLQYVYSQLEKQNVYPEAGNLQAHAQKSDGSTVAGWTRWNIALDGLYMSQVYLIKLADMIDNGTVVILDKNGSPVSAGSIRNDVYSRMMFVMNNMRNKDTGLLYHGYSTDNKDTNGVSWSRAIGWYSMALLEAAEGMTDSNKKAELTRQFASLMDSLLKWQDPESFLWYNVTDHQDDVTDNIPETSGSAMFAYCLLRGYRDGLLNDEAYRDAGLRTFNSIVETRMSDEGLTDTLKSSGVTSDINRYAVNEYVTNEAKGVAPLIMTASVIRESAF